MSDLMKYYIGEIRERNGDMEYNTKYLFTTNNDPDKYTDMVAMEWRGGDKGDYDEDQMGYWSDGTLIFDEGSNEIPKADYEVLKKHLLVMTIV